MSDLIQTGIYVTEYPLYIELLIVLQEDSTVCKAFLFTGRTVRWFK